MKIAAALSLIIFVLLVISCNKYKDAERSEPELYGTWVKVPNPADTLFFLRKNNQHIMRHLELYNAGVPVYSETEYKFADGKFSLKYSPADEYHPITSFAWTQPGTEFQVLGFHLFSYISSTMTVFTYKKI